MDYTETPRTELINLLEHADLTISNLRNELRELKENEAKLNSQIRYKHIENISEIKALQNMLLVSNSGNTHNEKNYLTKRVSDIVDRMIEEKIKKLDEDFEPSDLPF